MNPPTLRRPLGRSIYALRPVSMELGVQRQAAGSVLIQFGDTRVLCAASVEQGVPGWMKADALTKGWVTAEYGMLPGSGNRRIERKQNARATEIQRLIGRSLRSVVDLTALPGLTVTLDCDVLDADGGTRTASITGAWVALSLACRGLLREGRIGKSPIVGQVAAVSVGIVKATPLLDLDYLEDKDAEVDMNVVATETGRLVEVQGTAEGAPFERRSLDTLVDLALSGIEDLARIQREVLAII